MSAGVTGISGMYERCIREHASLKATLVPYSCFTRMLLRFNCLRFTLLVVGIMGVMTRMGSWGEVLVTVRDQWGEWVDCMGRLHNRDLVGLRKERRF